MAAGERTKRSCRKRSIAWLYYTVLAAVAVAAAVNTGNAQWLLASLGCGAYATYLFRGGRFVLWIW
jgi:hypothetical protein